MKWVTQGGAANHVDVCQRHEAQIKQALANGALGMMAADAGPVAGSQRVETAGSSVAVAVLMSLHGKSPFVRGH